MPCSPETHATADYRFRLQLQPPGNIYAGDTQYSNSNVSPDGLVSSLYGHETNRMYRQSYGITHNGIWDWGQSKFGVYYERPTTPARKKALRAKLRDDQ